MRRFVHAAIVVLVAIGATAACTPAQLSSFIDWHERDPAAAEAFARLPAINALVHDGAGSSSDGPQFREYLTNRHGATWDRIAWCESGGNWHYPPVTNSTGTYSGGLMIWTRAWVAYGGRQFAGQAWQASKAEQITVAERILADRGWGAWDCS